MTNRFEGAQFSARNLSLAVCAAAVLLIPCGKSAAADKPKLAGTWKLNKDQSDDPHQKMQQAVGNSGGMREGGGDRRGGNRGEQGSGRGQRGGMMEDLSQLTIEQTDSTAKIVGASGRVLALYSDSKPGDNSTPSAGDSDNPPAAKWQGDQLVVEMPGRRGGKMTRTYTLSPSGDQLYVTTQMEGGRLRQLVMFRFVYDPVKPN